MKNLTTLKAEELRVIAKEMKMPGAWKAKRAEMIEFIEANQVEVIEEENSFMSLEEFEYASDLKTPFIMLEAPKEEIEIKEVVEVKASKPRKNSREIILLDSLGKEVERFANQSKAAEYCLANKLCNRGWVGRSLKENESFYFYNGKPSKTQKGKYTGQGWKLVYSQEAN